MRLCKDCANRGKKEICQIHTSVSNYAERCKDFEQKESTGQIVKSVTQIVQQVSEDICDNYCKYQLRTMKQMNENEIGILSSLILLVVGIIAIALYLFG